MNDHDRKAAEHAESAGGHLTDAFKRVPHMEVANVLAVAQIEATLSLAHYVASIGERLDGVEIER